MDSNLDRIKLAHTMLQANSGETYTSNDRQTRPGHNTYIIRTQINAGRHTVYEQITPDIITLCILGHKEHYGITV